MFGSLNPRSSQASLDSHSPHVSGLALKQILHKAQKTQASLLALMRALDPASMNTLDLCSGEVRPGKAGMYNFTCVRCGASLCERSRCKVRSLD